MASDLPTTEAGHLVYPAGPPCTPACPGDWSTYHDGYAWGYEKATAEARAALIDELVAAVEKLPTLPLHLWRALPGDHDYGLPDPVAIDRAAVLSLLEGARHG